MRLHFLGGADEVGASAVLLEAAGKRVLVDAGVRMGAAARDPLPDLARVTDLGGLDAVLLTHAHLDHSGALPLVHGAFPKAPVWMTGPSRSLLHVLLLDALRIMQAQVDREGEVPLYPQPAVEGLLARAEVVPPLEPRSLPFGEGGAEWRVTFFPAGHVLGAAAVGLETPEGRVLVTGDVSRVDQLTVPGMPAPRFAPDVVVCESTYGNRLHASRRAEEQRLVSAVTETLRAGGSVLIPAFALGRAQEVLLLLRKALAAPEAPEATVYFDGMVRAICGVYAQHAEWLTPKLRERAEAGRGLFASGDGRVRPVSDPAERAVLLEGPPCVIVSSSGMLSGGPSVGYALGLCGRPEALIAITGYQDEEAPGRKLQELASGESRELVVDGRRAEVRCRVDTFGLSAHADAEELAGLLSHLRPGVVALVHGDGGARAALAERLLVGGQFSQVLLPGTGDTLDFGDLAKARDARRARGVSGGRGDAGRVRAVSGGGGDAGRARAVSGGRGDAADAGPRQAGMGRGAPLDVAALERLRDVLGRGRRGSLSAAEIAARWYGPAGVPEDLGPLHALLRSAPHCFTPDPKRPYLYRPAPPGTPAPEGLSGREGTGAAAASGQRDASVRDAEGRDAEGRLEQNLALARADVLLGPASGLYRRGADRERWTLRLFFRFPDVQAKACAAEIARLAEETGWAVEVHPEANLAALEQEARKVVEDAGLGRPLRSPSVRVDARQVVVQLPERPDDQVAQALDAAFLQETGFSLAVELGRATGAVAPKEQRDASGRLEVNQAFARIQERFSQVDDARPVRRSKRSGPDGLFLELGFITPEVGARYQEVIQDLEVETGWPIRVADRVDQQAVLAAVRARLPAGWQVKKGPGLDVARRTVRIKMRAHPPAEEVEALREALRAETGFSLELTV